VGHQARISTRLLVIHHDRREIIGAEKLNSLSARFIPDFPLVLGS
jgi:hypothetical protein